MESSEIEIDLHIYVQLIISKHARKFNGEGIVFSINGAGTIA